MILLVVALGLLATWRAGRVGGVKELAQTGPSNAPQSRATSGRFKEAHQ